MSSLRVLTWNIRGIRGIGSDRLAAIANAIESDGADVITLQEVSSLRELWPALRSALRERGYEHGLFSGSAAAIRKKYGNVIASRFPIAPADGSWSSSAPWPQLLARAHIALPSGDRVEVITVHAPNGSSNGWRKIDTLDVVARHLEGAVSMPRVLTGDFNEPESVAPFRSFGQVVHAAEPTLEGDLTRNGETHPRRRWDEAVVAILDGEHVRHAYFDRYGRGPVCTHVTRGKARFFDHILVSEHLEVVDSGFRHDWRETEHLSDHSAAWAALRLRA